MKIGMLKKVITAPLAHVPKKVIPKKLGVALSDGTIFFADQKSAIEYGIKKCQESLLAPKQFERAIGIKGSKVVYQIDGQEGFVPLHNATEIMIHSHPDTYAKGCATALSEGDYDYFIKKSCMKKIYAVNSNGEYYEMTKIPGFDFSKIRTEETFGDFNVCVKRTLFGHSGVPAEQRELLERCIKTKDEDAYYLEFYDKYISGPIRRLQGLPKTIVDKTHEFWVKFGERFGVKVNTNFSNFTVEA